jgi:hypothetical protein
MRRLLTQPGSAGVHIVLPPELEDLLEAGWREGPGGVLLLAPSEEYLSKRASVPPDDVGECEHQNNDFAVPGQDLAIAVQQFAPRLAAPGPLIDDDKIDYRMPDGEYPADVLGFLRGMAGRGVAFAARALTLAGHQQLPGAVALNAIVSTGIIGDVLVHGTTVKFTTARGVPSRWFDMRWFDDLERFKMDAMAVLTMADASPASS